MNWNEALRPTHPDHIVGNDGLVKDMKAWAESVPPSALLFVGPPGTGKSSAANVLVHLLLPGDANNEMNVLWTNASDDRGIDFIRSQIKMFARMSGIGTKRKLIVLDEADGLTPAAQDSLRGIMEQYADVCTFILTANYADKIREAIKSRCNIYTFDRVSPADGAKHLLRIQSFPQMIHRHDTQKGYEKIVLQHNGDLRAAVNFLQAGGTPSEEPVDDADPFAAVIHNNWLDLRDDLKAYLKSNGDRMSMMNHFHRKMSQYFDNDCDTVFSVLSVWGDMMERVYDWPGSTEAYIDVFVGRLKTKLEVENNE
jgi:replication factor C small subunit